jgi:hypothetical protein
MEAQALPRQSRIAPELSAKPSVELAGSVNPLTARAVDLGAVNSNLQLSSLTLNISLSAAQRQELATLQVALQDKKSPQYHKWLTQAEYGARFGLAEADLSHLKSWLTAQGFTVRGVSKSRNAITFSGKAWQVESVFHTQLHQYKLNGENHFANATALRVPAPIASLVMNVRGVDDFRPKPQLRKPVAQPNYTVSSSLDFLSPGDWATIYSLNAVYSAGFDGTGTDVAVVGQSYAPQSDIDNFRTASGLPATNLNYVCLPTTTVPCTDAASMATGYLAEADLDIEWAGGIAPNATVDYIYAPADDPSLGVLDALQYAIQNFTTVTGSVAPIISMSYTFGCEANFPLLPLMDALGQQASTQGQTLVVSAGDSGAAGCDTANDPTVTSATGGLAIEVPGDSPNYTAVGGTMFSGDVGDAASYWTQTNGLVNSAILYIPESPWNESSPTTGLAAGGGGESTAPYIDPTTGLPTGALQFPLPSWQSNLVYGALGRLVPDVSFSAAAGHDGYMTCTSDESATDLSLYGAECFSGGYVSAGGSAGQAFFPVGGTSASAPSFAGMLALFVQRYGPLGNINPVIYSIATDPTNYAASFQDIANGNNDIPCTGGTGCTSGLIGFAATAGYDEATGLGSVNGNGMLASLSNFFSQSNSATTVSAAPNPVVFGSSVDLTANVTSLVAGTLTGTVTFSTSASTLGSAPLVGGVASLTGVPTTATNGLALGSDTISATYSGDTNYLSSTGVTSLLVSTPYSSIVTVTGGPVVYGGTVTVTATVSSLSPGIPTGSVTFATNTVILGTVPIVAGVASQTFAATALNGISLGTNLITASYSGDSNFLPANGTLGLIVYDPALPLLLSLSSNTATAGGTGFTLTATGANFTPTSVILWNGSVRTTTYISSTQLSAAISATDITAAKTDLVTVANLSPAGISTALTFTVQLSAPIATITSATTYLTTDGSGNYALTLTGTGFLPSSVVDWNGTPAVTTTYISPGLLSATITSLATPATLTVVNPAGTSAGFQLQ